MLKFFWNGVKSSIAGRHIEGGELCPAYYGIGVTAHVHRTYGTGEEITIPADVDAIHIDAKGTCGRLPAELWGAAGVIGWNDTYSQTDYFAPDRIIVLSPSPHHADAVRAWLARTIKDATRFKRCQRTTIPADLLAFARRTLGLAADCPEPIVCDFCFDRAAETRDDLLTLLASALRPEKPAPSNKPRPPRKVLTVSSDKLPGLQFFARSADSPYAAFVYGSRKQALQTLARLQSENPSRTFALWESNRYGTRIVVDPPTACVVIDSAGVPTVDRAAAKAAC
jgi:hypothetical protein